MAPKKSTIVLNVEQFIRDIEERPAIWNRNFHCNKAFLEQMWDELSSQHKLPKVILKAKWKGLRDNFRVEYKRIPRADNGDFLVEPATFESKWIHYYALLFLTDHMRHRMPKTEQDQSYYFTQQSQDCEKTVVEPDLTNGLIRRMQDSDEEFDEDDIDDDDDEVTEATPPAAHSQSQASTANTAAIIKTEDTRSLLKASNSLLRAHAASLAALDDVEKEAQDLSKKSKDTSTTTKSAVVSTSSAIMSPTSSSSCIASTNSAAAAAVALTANNSSTPISLATTNSGGSTTSASLSGNQQHGKKRSVSPPPLYNKAHHPPPNAATSLNSAAALSKERDDFSLNGSSCLHGSHEHLTFTKHSYANGLIPALKLKRPRLSEDSNFNGSSTMDNTAPLVPEDDDYHYLLSLHPYMKQLTAAQKLRIRTKIQKLIFKELYKEDLEETK